MVVVHERGRNNFRNTVIIWSVWKDMFINYPVKATCNGQRARDEDSHLISSHWLASSAMWPVSGETTNLYQPQMGNKSELTVTVKIRVRLKIGPIFSQNLSEVGVYHVSMVKLMHMMRPGMQ